MWLAAEPLYVLFLVKQLTSQPLSVPQCHWDLVSGHTFCTNTSGHGGVPKDTRRIKGMC